MSFRLFLFALTCIENLQQKGGVFDWWHKCKFYACVFYLVYSFLQLLHNVFSSLVDRQNFPNDYTHFISCNHVHTNVDVYVMVVTWPWGICLIYMYPDMYARSPRAAGLRAEGTHIRQIMNGHVTSIMYHFVPIVTTPVVWIP